MLAALRNIRVFLVMVVRPIPVFRVVPSRNVWWSILMRVLWLFWRIGNIRVFTLRDFFRRLVVRVVRRAGISDAVRPQECKPSSSNTCRSYAAQRSRKTG